MNQGIILFAHSTNEVDYGLLSVISAGLAKKYLKLPVSLITDDDTKASILNSDYSEKAKSIFDQFIIIDRPKTNNKRNLNNKTVPFINSNRKLAWDYTPYDQTLLIDSDFLIFSDSLNQYWSDADVSISTGIIDLLGNRSQILDKRISEEGIKMFWATTVMFKKNKVSKLFFDLISHIQENYDFYSDVFKFDSRQYRNDISFSIAKHILDGFDENLEYALPDIFTTLDQDIFVNLDQENNLVFLLKNKDSYILSGTRGNDVHVLNKISIIENKEKFLKLI